jgi:hypothetical protein
MRIRYRVSPKLCVTFRRHLSWLSGSNASVMQHRSRLNVLFVSDRHSSMDAKTFCYVGWVYLLLKHSSRFGGLCLTLCLSQWYGSCAANFSHLKIQSMVVQFCPSSHIHEGIPTFPKWADNRPETPKRKALQRRGRK